MGTVRTMENTPKGDEDKPLKDVIIADCGVLLTGEPDGVPIPVVGDI